MRYARIIFAITWVLCAPTPALAYPRAVEAWRPVVRYELRRQHVWSRFAEEKCLHIIDGESDGDQRAGHVRGCYGLLQYNTSWVRERNDWRGNGRTSIRTFVTLYRKFGTAPLKRHWAATYW